MRVLVFDQIWVQCLMDFSNSRIARVPTQNGILLRLRITHIWVYETEAHLNDRRWGRKHDNTDAACPRWLKLGPNQGRRITRGSYGLWGNCTPHQSIVPETPTTGRELCSDTCQSSLSQLILPDSITDVSNFDQRPWFKEYEEWQDAWVRMVLIRGGDVTKIA